MGNEIAER